MKQPHTTITSVRDLKAAVSELMTLLEGRIVLPTEKDEAVVFRFAWKDLKDKLDHPRRNDGSAV